MPRILSVEQLNERHAIDGLLSFDAGEGGLSRAILTTPAGDEAHVYLHGAHVNHYQPAGQQPVLFSSVASWFEADKPIRGGVPVCFPWFGPNPTDPDLPAHGFARLIEWQFRKAQPINGGVALTLALTDDDETRDLWDNRFIATMKVELTDALAMTLTVVNTNMDETEGAFSFEAALHTYLHVSDIKAIEVRGLENVSYLDKVDNAKRKNQGGRPVTFTGETDRVYLDTQSTCTFEDAGLGRRIAVEKTGSDTTVVWNPWIDKAARMPDFGDDEWPRMLCIETANAAQNAVTLKPGDTHVMGAVVRVS